MNPTVVYKDKCILFEDISKYVWHKIIKNQRNGIPGDEKGITSDILTEIRESSRVNSTIGVWADPGRKESEYGSDIDVMIEVMPGRFLWIALQAKLINGKGNFPKLGYKSKGEHQYTKLERLRKLTGCQIRYLLFCGDDKFRFNSIDGCGRAYNEEQYGCSIIDTRVIKQYVNTKVLYPRKSDFANLIKYMHPWRILTCCPLQINTALFDYKDLKEYLKRYDRISEQDVLRDYKEEEFYNASGPDVDSKNPNPMTTGSDRVGRKADGVFVFTDPDLKQPDNFYRF